MSVIYLLKKNVKNKQKRHFFRSAAFFFTPTVLLTQLVGSRDSLEQAFSLALPC